MTTRERWFLDAWCCARCRYRNQLSTLEKGTDERLHKLHAHLRAREDELKRMGATVQSSDGDDAFRGTRADQERAKAEMSSIKAQLARAQVAAKAEADKAAKLAAANTKWRDGWEADLAHVVEHCTVATWTKKAQQSSEDEAAAARREEEARREEAARPWRQKKLTPKEQLAKRLEAHAVRYIGLRYRPVWGGARVAMAVLHALARIHISPTACRTNAEPS